LSLADASNARLEAADFNGAAIGRLKLHAAALHTALLGGARGDPIGTDEHRLVAEAYRPAPVQDDQTTGPGSEP
jgi:uncharacterized protein YjbI with pentapeptide repeats